MNLLLFLLLLVPHVHSQEPSRANELIDKLSDQEVKEMANHLANLFGLPNRQNEFNVNDREKRMIKSENKFLLDLYQRRQSPRQQYSGNGQRSVVNKSNYIITFGAKSLQTNEDNSQLVLGFNLTGIPDVKQLVTAELRVFRQSDVGHRDKNFNVLTYTYINQEKYLLSMDVWGEKDHGWRVVNITDIIVNKVEDFVKIHMSAKLNHKEVRVTEEMGVFGLRSNAEKRPFLVIYFATDLKLNKNEQPRMRAARSRTDSPSPQLNLPAICSLQVFYVNFSKLDAFGSVLKPDQFQANYCAGSCNFPLQSEIIGSNHALVQSFYSSVKKPPFCAPREMLPLNIIHLNKNGNAVHKTYENMIVKSCACF